MQRHFASLLAFAAGFLSAWAASSASGQNPEFRARLAAWQQPQSVGGVGPSGGPTIASPPVAEEAYYEQGFAEASGGCGSGTCGGGCNGGCGGIRGFRDIGRDPGCRACMTCRPPRWWLRSDGLLWWRKGRDLPVLVTSSDDVNVVVGEIVLYGGEVESGPPQGGARIDFGTWLDPNECLGVGGRFWGTGKERTRFDADSDSVPDQTIERPFFLADGTPESLVISDSNFGISGSIEVVSTSEVFGTDVYARLHWWEGCNMRIDLVGGYQFTRLNEELRIVSDSAGPSGPDLVIDDWRTRNEFHGGVIGLRYESCRGCWTTTCLVKVGLGSMRQTAELTGSDNDVPGGLYVEEPTTVTRDKFAAVPELDVAWSYAINPCWSMNVGYSLLYWSNVIRPEELIDPIRGNDTSLIFRDSSFWVQGLTVGASCRF